MADKRNRIDDRDEDNKDESEQSVKKSLSTVKIVIIAIVLTIVVVGGAVGTTVFFMSGSKTDAVAVKADQKKSADTAANTPASDAENSDQEEGNIEVEKGPAIYTSLDPKFVVSFNDQGPVRFMQFSVDLLMHNSDVKDQIKLHMPAIRSSLLMLFGDQKSKVMGTKKGKEKLLQDIASDVNLTLEKMEGSKAIPHGVESAYFTSFVVQ